MKTKKETRFELLAQAGEVVEFLAYRKAHREAGLGEVSEAVMENIVKEFNRESREYRYNKVRGELTWRRVKLKGLAKLVNDHGGSWRGSYRIVRRDGVLTVEGVANALRDEAEEAPTWMRFNDRALAEAFVRRHQTETNVAIDVVNYKMWTGE